MGEERPLGLWVHDVSKQLTQVDSFFGAPKGEPPVFDRTVLMHHAMHDAALATEVLALFEAQLQRLEHLDWEKLDLAFEMHTLRGAIRRRLVRRPDDRRAELRRKLRRQPARDRARLLVPRPERAA